MGIETWSSKSLWETRGYQDYRDEREARTQVTGYATTYNDEEDEGADTGEEDGGVGIKAHENGGKHGGPEHGQHMLQANKNCLYPGKPLVWRDNTLCLEGPVRKVALLFLCFSCHGGVLLLNVLR